MENILEVENLCKGFSNGDFALDKVSFSIPYGSIMGFVGENGAGKTTTISCILNTMFKDSGTIKLFGKALSDDDTELREKIGVVYDGDNFPAYWTAEQLSNVMQGLYKKWDDTLFQIYLEKFQLQPKKKIKHYSRGMTMKLAVAAALSHHPQLLILDEATSGLDPIMRDDMLDVFLDFVQEENHSILLASINKGTHVGQPAFSVLFALFSLAGDSPPASKRTKIPRKSKAVRCEAVLPEQKCSQTRKRPQRILCVFSRALTQYEGISARQNRVCPCQSTLSSHITSDLEKIADYITFIHNGKLIMTASKNDLVYNFAVIRCKESQFRQLDPHDILAYRKRDFQTDVLVANGKEAERKYRGCIVDHVSVDEIMLLLVKGTRV